MYMREMGTVELLTREGEIRIAKRIEEGLDAVRSALAMYPPTYDFLLRAYEPVKAGQARLVDVIVGFIDPNAPDVIAQPQNPTKVEVIAPQEKGDDEEEGEEADSDEEAIDTGPDPAEAAARFASIAKIHAHVPGSIAKPGAPYQGRQEILRAARQVQGRDRAAAEEARAARRRLSPHDQRRQGSQPRRVDWRGQGAPRQEGNGRGQSAPGHIHRQEIHQPRP